MRTGSQHFLKMFNRTSSVFYPTHNYVNQVTPYKITDVLSSYLLRQVEALNSKVLRSQKGTPVPGALTNELADGVWGLNTH